MTTTRGRVAATGRADPGPIPDTTPEILRAFPLRQAAWLLNRRESEVRGLVESGALRGYREELPLRPGDRTPRFSQYRIPGWAIREYQERMCLAHRPTT